ncbi:hypothetical protein F5144DRAFT_606894 [Chaetomium tenue]|uniref:Uncharacterized protein n=1 Tax=Chaetomium tenue TaxID=1854479 RepID=A0ACB7NVI0_9PEZI|nr:hypothetical protein F5144DRAFT_606894 [Chaetomium globosum]
MKLGSEPGDEATVREGLLKERMLAMLRQVQSDCIKERYDIYAISSPRPAVYTGSDDDEDDTVSICSDDIGRDDRFGWYNNSRDFLVIETIPCPSWVQWSNDGSRLPPQFVELPTTSGIRSPPPPPPATNGNTTAGPSTLPSPLGREQIRFSAFGDATPVHGGHWQCKWINIWDDVPSKLFRCLPDLVCLHVVDDELTLRPEITELPAQGRKWLTGSPDSLFVEVVDPTDGTWVCEPEVRRGWKAESGQRVGDWGESLPYGDYDSEQERDTVIAGGTRRKGSKYQQPPSLTAVLEYVAWLRVVLARQFREDQEKGMPTRKVDVAIVAYLVLDAEGKVDFHGRAKKRMIREPNQLVPDPSR